MLRPFRVVLQWEKEYKVYAEDRDAAHEKALLEALHDDSEPEWEVDHIDELDDPFTIAPKPEAQWRESQL